MELQKLDSINTNKHSDIQHVLFALLIMYSNESNNIIDDLYYVKALLVKNESVLILIWLRCDFSVWKYIYQSRMILFKYDTINNIEINTCKKWINSIWIENELDIS